MFDIGFSELLLVGVLGLIILGPERLPKAARTVGLLIGRMRRTMSGIQQEIEQEVRNQEIREKLKDPMSTFMGDTQSDKKQPAQPTNTVASSAENTVEQASSTSNAAAKDSALQDK